MSDIFTQTEKGKAEFAAKPGKLSTGLKTLLGLVGEKATLSDIKIKLPQVPVPKITAALDALVKDGYLRRATALQSGANADDLDFTRFINRPVKEPTLQQKKNAEATIAGIRASGKAGYHVTIINRAAKRIPARAGGEQHTILVIDADDSNALVVTRALLLAKFDTRAASKRDEIIAQLNKKPPPDAVAMDVDLPDVGGLELLARMRDHPTFKSIPIVVMTGKVEHDDVVATLAYGANGFMTKPLKPESVVESVKAVLGI